MHIILSNDATIVGLRPETLQILRDYLVIPNPLFHKRLDLGLSNWNIPITLKYYEDLDDTSISVPIGVLSEILDILYDEGYNPHPQDIIDNRTTHGNVPFFATLRFTGKLRGYQQEILDACLPATVGHVEAMTGCHAKGTRILMYSGNFKSVEDVKTNDIIMGWDSTPRKVLTLCGGFDTMYQITPHNGTPFVINEEHYLTLRHTVGKHIVDIQLKEFLKLKPMAQKQHKLFRRGVTFAEDQNLPLDPYFLGALLGDGSLDSNLIMTTADEPIAQVVYQQAKKFNCSVRKAKGKGCYSYYITNNYKHNNPIKNILKELELFGKKSGTKFIPKNYKLASRQSRLELLAGILDTDGHLYRGLYFDYLSKSETLANDVVFLSRSLGLRANVISTKKYSQTGKGGIYFRVSICGDVDIIPCKLTRKNTFHKKPNKNALVTGFTVEKLKRDRYYGFVIGGDHRYLFEDFYVTHNSGKTIAFVALTVERKQSTLVLVNTVELANQTVNAFTKFTNLNKEDIGFIGAGQFELKPITVGLHQTMTKLSEKRFAKVNDSIGQVIADEVHICPAETYYRTMSSLTAKYKFGFSATPKREDGLTKVIHYASGPKIHVVDQKHLKEVLIKPDVRYIKTNYNFPLISSEEYQELLNDLSSDEERTKLILGTLINDYNDKHIIILCVRVAQVKYLKEALGNRAAMLHSGMRKKERLKVMGALQSGETKIVISTYGLFSTGIDIPQLEVLLLAAPIKSEIKLRQASGRLMRMSKGKESATIVDFVDNKVDLLRYQGYHRKRIFKKLEQDL